MSSESVGDEVDWEVDNSKSSKESNLHIGQQDVQDLNFGKNPINLNNRADLLDTQLQIGQPDVPLPNQWVRSNSPLIGDKHHHDVSL